MKKAGGIISLIAGVIGILAAISTRFIGGLGESFLANGASTLTGGIGISFAVIIFSARAMSAKNKKPAIWLIVASISGALIEGGIVAMFMALALLGGIMVLVGVNNELKEAIKTKSSMEN